VTFVAHVPHVCLMVCMYVCVCVQSLIGRDRLRECLEKDRSDRTDDDIEVLLDFMQHLPVSTRPSPLTSEPTST
jgi:hypothetical protein